MRFLLVFFALFTPLSWLLWYLAGDSPPPVSLPQPTRGDSAEAVIRSREIPRVPIDGQITAFRNGRIQRFHKKLNYVELWVQIEGIARVEGKPRLQGIRCAIFGEPRGAEARLRLTLDAPYLEGDPLALLGDRRGMQREVVMGGGVIVRDQWGRTVAQLDRLIIDLNREEVRSDGPVLFESPEKSAQLRGTGLVADLRFDSATLLSNVTARLPLGKGGAGVAVLSCRGPATLVRVPGTEDYVVTLEDGAHIEHDSARGDCDRITAFFRRVPGKSSDGEDTEEDQRRVEVERIMLDGNVFFELDREIARGLESFRADSITILGEREIILAGDRAPVRAVRRGPLEMLGLADRVIDLDAPEIRILFVENAGDSDAPLESISFPRGVHLQDRDGSGELRANRLVLDVRAGRVEADRGVTATSPGRKLVADRIVVGRPPARPDTVVAAVFGNKRFELSPTGQIDPLARGALRLLVFTSTEPLHFEQIDNMTTVRTSGDVRVIGDDRELLRCQSIRVSLKDKSVRNMEATGDVAVHHPETGADIRADRLVFDSSRGNEVRLFGEPTTVVQADRGAVRAREMYYREDGSFGALREVDLELKLAKGKAAGTWKFHAADAKGLLRKDRRPEWFRAAGTVEADGPNGERLEADSVRYEEKTSLLTLKGKPARLRQGDEISYEGSGLTIRVVEAGGSFALENVDLVGATDLVLRPRPAKGEGKNQFALWKLRLLGPAEFDQKRLRVPAGARIRGYDERGRLLLEGSADDVTVEVAREGRGFRPTALRARKRVEMTSYKNGKFDSRVRAKTLDFTMGERKIDIGGGGSIERPGLAKPIRFREAEFDLTDHGVDLKYLSEMKGELR